MAVLRCTRVAMFRGACGSRASRRIFRIVVCQEGRLDKATLFLLGILRHARGHCPGAVHIDCCYGH